MFDTDTRAKIAKLARRLNVSAAALLAVAEVESAGRIFAKVQGRNEPVIRFEGHYFDRFLKGDARMEARAEGLANPKAGAVKNPNSQAKRWALLNRAIKINRTAALSSVSWGLGQVMGSHWQWLGYGSVDALVADARQGIDGQVAIMCRYIEKAGLVKALQEQDWTAFARTYNGPAYKKNRYDEKMAKAFLRYARELGETSPPALPKIAANDESDTFRFGDRGAAVKALQKSLTERGYILVADGVFGLVTEKVIRQFQRDHFLSETGQFGRDENLLLEGRWPQMKRKSLECGTKVSTTAARSLGDAKSRFSQASRAFRKRVRKGLLSISRRIA